MNGNRGKRNCDPTNRILPQPSANLFAVNPVRFAISGINECVLQWQRDLKSWTTIAPSIDDFVNKVSKFVLGADAPSDGVSKPDQILFPIGRPTCTRRH